MILLEWQLVPIVEEFFTENLIHYFGTLNEKLREIDATTVSESEIGHMIKNILLSYMDCNMRTKECKFRLEEINKIRDLFLKNNIGEELLKIIKEKTIAPVFRVNFDKHLQRNSLIFKKVIDSAVNLFFDNVISLKCTNFDDIVNLFVRVKKKKI